jgi:hypothetical protein
MTTSLSQNHIFEIGAGDELEMDVTGVALTQSKSLDGREHLLHRGVGVGRNARAVEQAIHALLALE